MNCPRCGATFYGSQPVCGCGYDFTKPPPAELVEDYRKNMRPWPVSVACALAGLGAIGGLAYTVGTFNQHAFWYLSLAALFTAATYVGIAGLWMMRRWGGLLFLTATIGGQIAAFVDGSANPFGLGMTLLLASVVLAVFPRLE